VSWSSSSVRTKIFILSVESRRFGFVQFGHEFHHDRAQAWVPQRPPSKRKGSSSEREESSSERKEFFALVTLASVTPDRPEIMAAPLRVPKHVSPNQTHPRRLPPTRDEPNRGASKSTSDSVTERMTAPLRVAMHVSPNQTHPRRLPPTTCDEPPGTEEPALVTKENVPDESTEGAERLNATGDRAQARDAYNRKREVIVE
jgi:hypothetical protein